MRPIAIAGLGVAALVGAAGLFISIMSNTGPSDTTTAGLADTIETVSGDVLELGWDDLLPDGEIARIEALHAEFYEALAARYTRAPQSSLLDAGKQAEDAGLGDLADIPEGSAADVMPQIGTFNVVEALLGKTVKIPGYTVPLNFSMGNKHREFLFVPYFGACLHAPPPPPNQILYVRANPPVPITNITLPIWVEGVLTAERSETEMADTAYTLTLTKTEPYIVRDR